MSAGAAEVSIPAAIFCLWSVDSINPLRLGLPAGTTPYRAHFTYRRLLLCGAEPRAPVFGWIKKHTLLDMVVLWKFRLAT